MKTDTAIRYAVLVLFILLLMADFALAQSAGRGGSVRGAAQGVVDWTVALALILCALGVVYVGVLIIGRNFGQAFCVIVGIIIVANYFDLYQVATTGLAR